MKRKLIGSLAFGLMASGLMISLPIALTSCKGNEEKKEVIFGPHNTWKMTWENFNPYHMKADGGSYGFYFFQKQENGEWTRGAPDGLTGFTDGSDIERGWSVIDFGSITAAPYDILYKEIDPTSLKASGEDRIHLWQWSDPKYIPITFYFDR